MIQALLLCQSWVLDALFPQGMFFPGRTQPVMEKKTGKPALTFLSNVPACHSSAYLKPNGSCVKQQDNRRLSEVWVGRRMVVLKYPKWFLKGPSRIDPRVDEVAGTRDR